MSVVNSTNKGQLYIVVLLLLFFVSNSLNVLLSHYSYIFTHQNLGVYVRVGSFIKGFVLICLLVYLVKGASLMNSVKVFLVLSVFAIVGVDVDNKIHVLTWMLYLTKLLFPILLYFYMKSHCVGEPVFKLFSWIIFFQTITVIIAFLFGIDLFLTYGKNRFGYSGWFISQNEATFFYVLAFVFSFKRAVSNRSIFNVIVLILVVVSSMILGTKSVFILLLSSPILFFLYKRSLKILVAVIIGLFLLLFFLFLIGHFDYYILFAKESDLITMFTSFRNILIQERVPLVLESWQWYNYLFGGVNPSISFVEMDIIDLFLFGGIIGSVIYYWLLFKTLFAFKRQDYFGWFLVSMFFIIGGIAGHFFASGVNVLFFALVCYFLQVGEKGIASPSPI